MLQSLRVKEQHKVCPEVMSLTLEAPELAALAQPGQFAMLKNWEGPEPFLMRPVSFNGIDAQAGTVTFLYKLVGRGTHLLAAAGSGDRVEVMGPLGRGFPVDPSFRRVAVIGRGIGIAPLRPLVERYRALGAEVYVYLSAKSPEYLFHQEDFAALDAALRCSTDPAVNVTDAFEADVERLRFDAAYSCGSKRLALDMKRLHRICGFPAWVSLEEHMACGVGACKGCVCKARDEDGTEYYRRVCKDGPVFDIERVVIR